MDTAFAEVARECSKYLLNSFRMIGFVISAKKRFRGSHSRDLEFTICSPKSTWLPYKRYIDLPGPPRGNPGSRRGTKFLPVIAASINTYFPVSTPLPFGPVRSIFMVMESKAEKVQRTLWYSRCGRLCSAPGAKLIWSILRYTKSKGLRLLTSPRIS